jgi:hypothetical protein
MYLYGSDPLSKAQSYEKNYIKGQENDGGGKGKKKPPVFIGLGAVYNRNLNTLFREPRSPGLSKDWIKNFHGCSLAA